MMSVTFSCDPLGVPKNYRDRRALGCRKQGNSAAPSLLHLYSDTAVALGAAFLYPNDPLS